VNTTGLIKGGTFISVTRCICGPKGGGAPAPQDPTKTDAGRSEFDKVRDKLREEFKKLFGWDKWPKDKDGKPWEIHHVDPIGEGGHPTDINNTVPAPKDKHDEFHKAYRDARKGRGGWSEAGPDWPYTPLPPL
jgi:hypothetical protein